MCVHDVESRTNERQRARQRIVGIGPGARQHDVAQAIDRSFLITPAERKQRDVTVGAQGVGQLDGIAIATADEVDLVAIRDRKDVGDAQAYSALAAAGRLKTARHSAWSRDRSASHRSAPYTMPVASTKITRLITVGRSAWRTIKQAPQEMRDASTGARTWRQSCSGKNQWTAATA